ncbi:MAG: hypothetical protein RLZZ330_483 [Actinomycetota bacterium]|jgi:hypothetical protein
MKLPNSPNELRATPTNSVKTVTNVTKVEFCFYCELSQTGEKLWITIEPCVTFLTSVTGSWDNFGPFVNKF